MCTRKPTRPWPTEDTGPTGGDLNLTLSASAHPRLCWERAAPEHGGKLVTTHTNAHSHMYEPVPKEAIFIKSSALVTNRLSVSFTSLLLYSIWDSGTYLFPLSAGSL